MCGKGYCHWTEKETRGTGDNRRTVTVHYYGKETIFNWKQVLADDPSQKKFHLPAGSYKYPFQFTLPTSLPSSFEYHKHVTGYIRYYVKAKIDKPWKFDHKVKRPFTVNDIIDTNNPMYLQPIGGDGHREPGCCCCKSGPVNVTANIDRQVRDFIAFLLSIQLYCSNIILIQCFKHKVHDVTFIIFYNDFRH